MFYNKYTYNDISLPVNKMIKIIFKFIYFRKYETVFEH